MTNRVQVAPIAADDMLPVAEFLHAHLNERVPTDHWAEALEVPWDVQSPNAGFMLVDDGEVVGAQVAFYSEREIDGHRERFCNLGAWCVLPEYRFYSLKLLRAALSQEGYHFTDLSPSGNVIEINRRLDFRFLDTSTVLVPSILWPTPFGDNVISSDPRVVERLLGGRDLKLYRDHASTGAARHLVASRGGEVCYVVFRKDRWKRIPLFVSLLHVSNPELFRALARPIASHLLLHHGAIATLAEPRVLGYRPRLAFAIRSPRRKMFRSAGLEPAAVDDLYSELVCVSW